MPKKRESGGRIGLPCWDLVEPFEVSSGAGYREELKGLHDLERMIRTNHCDLGSKQCRTWIFFPLSNW